MEKKNKAFSNDMGNPLSQYTIEECAKMSPEEFDALLEADNEYVRQKYAKSNEREESKPVFNSIEEVIAYYDAIPLDEVLNNIDKLFKNP